MKTSKRLFLKRFASALFLVGAGASSLIAQTNLVLPEGSVIIVRTMSALESTSARAGQTFETTVVDTVRIDDYTVIPAGSRIRGVVTFAQPADRQRSGVIEVDFNRLTLTDGTSYNLSGRLTSTDPEERRQIESDPDSRVVLVGGRGGIGAAIAGTGAAEGSTAASFLSALGSFLSEGRDVRVPAGSPLAVQLEQGLVLRGRGSVRPPDAFTIFTAADRIRAAQQALAQRNYYRGAANGRLDDATQRALFEFQIDQGIIATGNLDGRTAQALGLSTTSGPAVLTADEASVLRRGAQALVGRLRQDLAISTDGRLDPRRVYSEADIDVWFALSAFADNSSLYEQLVRVSGSAQGAGLASMALVDAARDVDAALQQARTTSQVQNAWANIRMQLTEIDPAYR